MLRLGGAERWGSGGEEGCLSEQGREDARGQLATVARSTAWEGWSREARCCALRFRDAALPLRRSACMPRAYAVSPSRPRLRPAHECKDDAASSRRRVARR